MDETKRPGGRRRGRPTFAGDMAVDEQACLHAALSAFADHGFEGTSVREVARTLGISHGLLNAKFGSKRDLWEAAVGYGMDLLHAHMSALPADEAQGDIVRRMRIACRNFVVGLSRVPAIIRLMNVEGAREGDRLDFVADRFFRRRTWPIQRLLLEGQEVGLFRAMPSAIPFTLLAHGAGALIVLRPLVEATEPAPGAKPESLVDYATEAADLIVRGLLADPPSNAWR